MAYLENAGIFLRDKTGKQLYTLLKKLGTYAQNKDESGTLVGYIIIGSFINFKTRSGSEEEKRFEEIKAVYSYLEDVIEYCKSKDCYSTLCDVTVKVNASRKSIILNKQYEETDSNLLNEVIESSILARSDYTDVLRRRGLRLLDEVSSRGELFGNKNILKKDYEIIRDYFIENKRR